MKLHGCANVRVADVQAVGVDHVVDATDTTDIDVQRVTLVNAMNVTSNDQANGITAGIVNVCPAHQSCALTDENKVRLPAMLSKEKPVAVIVRDNDRLGASLALDVYLHLASLNYRMLDSAPRLRLFERQGAAISVNPDANFGTEGWVFIEVE